MDSASRSRDRPARIPHARRATALSPGTTPSALAVEDSSIVRAAGASGQAARVVPRSPGREEKPGPPGKIAGRAGLTANRLATREAGSARRPVLARAPGGHGPRLGPAPERPAVVPGPLQVVLV